MDPWPPCTERAGPFFLCSHAGPPVCHTLSSVTMNARRWASLAHLGGNLLHRAWDITPATWRRHQLLPMSPIHTGYAPVLCWQWDTCD